MSLNNAIRTYVSKGCLGDKALLLVTDKPYQKERLEAVDNELGLAAKEYFSFPHFSNYLSVNGIKSLDSMPRLYPGSYHLICLMLDGSNDAEWWKLRNELNAPFYGINPSFPRGVHWAVYPTIFGLQAKIENDPAWEGLRDKAIRVEI